MEPLAPEIRNELARFGPQAGMAELVPTHPLLLLDDVLSELDGSRRRVLAERIARMEQTVVTATQASALPAEPAQIVEVTRGKAV